MNEHGQWREPADSYEPLPEPPQQSGGAAAAAIRPNKWLVITTAIAVAALIAGLLIGNAWRGRDNNTFAALPASERIELFNEDLVQGLYASAIKAVVQIETTQGQAGAGIIGRGQGSGFLVSNKGELLTNYHVVQGASRLTVILDDGTRLPAEVAGTDPSNDIALVKVNSDAIKTIAPLALGDSSLVRPGQLAIALGSPYGYQGTVTVGVVSGTDRSLPSVTRRPITGMIQTDAAIFPGNSGGPLLNSHGEVIGINTAVTSGTGNERLGFAVPSNTAKSVLSRLVAGATIKRPWLGVSLLTLDQERAVAAGLSVRKGVYIVDVVKGSPAEKFGLRKGSDASGQPAPGGDVVIDVDGKAVSTVDDLITYFNSKQPNDTVTITIIRDGKEAKVTVTLAEWPDSLS